MKAKPKLSKAAAKAFDLKHFGSEPVIKGDSNLELITAYNWFNYICDSNDARRFVLEYLEAEPTCTDSYISKVKRIDPFELRTIGWTFRLAMNGSKIEKDRVAKCVAKLTKLAEAVSDAKVTDTADYMIGVFDREIESAIQNDYSEFLIPTFIADTDTTPSIANKVVRYYRGAKGEWQKIFADAIIYAFERKHPSIVVVESTEEVVKVVRPRKPRKKKVKTPEQLTKSVQYLPVSEEYGLTSVAPTAIIGATQVWLFDVKYRKLSRINAPANSGLSVKGTTIFGFDERSSITKKLRKPKDVLKILTDGGKIAVRKVMESINTTEVKATGRINKDTVIVKIIKDK
jgi:hypothetical protein